MNRQMLALLIAMAGAANSFAADPATHASAVPILVKPYLQLGYGPTPTTLRVLWHAPDSDQVWSVEHRPVGSSGAWTPAGSVGSRRIAVPGTTPHRVLGATLSGLEPGGRFEYRVKAGSDVLFSAEGRAPKSASQKYRFLAVGDCGAGTPEQKPIALLAHRADVDLAVIPGDIVYEDGLISEYHEKFWPVYNADIADRSGAPLLRSIPFVAAPGNHDIDNRDLGKNPDGMAYFLYWEQPLNGPIGKVGGPFVPAIKGPEANIKAFTEAAGKAFPRMANFSFDYGNTHWLLLDSNNPVDWTNPEIRDWVAKDLAAAKSATWRFVAFHHPGFNSSREHFEQQQMRLLAPIFEAGMVDIVFSGHVHNYQRSMPMTFVPDRQGTQLMGGRDGKTIRGRVVNGRWTLDHSFGHDGDTTPKGIIYVVTGAGGQHLYNPEQQDDPDSWQKFTEKFVGSCSTSGVRLSSEEDGQEVVGHRLEVVDPLEDGHVAAQVVLAHAPEGPQERPQRGPGPLHRVDVHLADPVAVVVAGPLLDRVVHRRPRPPEVRDAVVARPLVGVQPRTGARRRLDHAIQGPLVGGRQDVQPDRAGGAAEGAGDRRAVVGEGAVAATLVRAAPRRVIGRVVRDAFFPPR